MDRIRIDYYLDSRRGSVQELARGIALEQTLEVPEALVREHGLTDWLGTVEELRPVDGEPDIVGARISYDASLASGQLPQLLNLICGNISFQPGVRIVNIEFPDSLLAKFPGPKLGIPGIRSRLGVYERPILSTALKPRGVDVPELARMAGEFALGGGDLVKDDHNLVDRSLGEFRERVARCQEAVQQASARTGRVTLYLPYLCVPAEQLEEALGIVGEYGVEGVLLAPALLGLDTTRSIAARHPLVIMGHPTFTGGHYIGGHHGLEHGLYLGTLYRLAGVDISVFTNFGGRFSFTREQCIDIGARLREPLGDLRPSFPSPAGGMQLENIPQMCEDFGRDSVLLIGGALLGHSADLAQSTRRFLEEVEKYYPGRYSSSSASASPAP